MDYNDAALFKRVVESGSFTSAAQALGMPKSSVSRNVARLEQDLGVRLLQRTTRRLALTDAGQAFFERVRGAVSGLEEAEDTVREAGSEPRGIVRMTVPGDSQAVGVAPLLREFCAQYPSIHVEVSVTGRRVDLVAEGFDLAVRAGVLPDSTLIARRLAETQMMIFAAPSYLARCARPETLQDLEAHDCILFRARGGRATWSLTGPKGPESIEVHGPISADEMGFCVGAAVAGAGIAFLPTELAHSLVEAGELEVVLPSYSLSGGGLYLVMPSAVFVPSRVTLLWDFLAERITERLAQVAIRCKEPRRPAPPAKKKPAPRARKRR